MSVNGLNTALSGMQANQFRVDNAANNIANVNTDGFQSQSVQTQDRAYINDIGQGTQVAATYTNPRPGPRFLSMLEQSAAEQMRSKALPPKTKLRQRRNPTRIWSMKWSI